tara:strand:+ start:507 stop:701 length:195 start_codon:yes stop_codon:yes gene_type:complete
MATSTRLEQLNSALIIARRVRDTHAEGCTEWDYEVGCLECAVLDVAVSDLQREIRAARATSEVR